MEGLATSALRPLNSFDTNPAIASTRTSGIRIMFRVAESVVRDCPECLLIAGSLDSSDFLIAKTLTRIRKCGHIIPNMLQSVSLSMLRYARSCSPGLRKSALVSGDRPGARWCHTERSLMIPRTNTIGPRKNGQNIHVIVVPLSILVID